VIQRNTEERVFTWLNVKHTGNLELISTRLLLESSFSISVFLFGGRKLTIGEDLEHRFHRHDFVLKS
jgi:hypothetical protein